MSSNPVSRKNSSATPVNEKAEQRRDVESTSKARTVAVAAFGFLAVLAAGAGFTLALRPEAVGLSNLDAPFKVVAGVGGGLVLGVTGVGAYAFFKNPVEKLEKETSPLEKLRKERGTLGGKIEQLQIKERDLKGIGNRTTEEDRELSVITGELSQAEARMKEIHQQITDLEN